MKSLRKVSKLERVVFPLVVMVLCIMVVPDASALIAMLMLGNLLRESGVVDRLVKACQNEIINVTTIFLGTAVGMTMQAEIFLRPTTLAIIVMVPNMAGVIGTAVAAGYMISRLAGQ